MRVSTCVSDVMKVVVAESRGVHSGSRWPDLMRVLSGVSAIFWW